jgi:hypothetical protein
MAVTHFFVGRSERLTGTLAVLQGIVPELPLRCVNTEEMLGGGTG